MLELYGVRSTLLVALIQLLLISILADVNFTSTPPSTGTVPNFPSIAYWINSALNLILCQKSSWIRWIPQSIDTCVHCLRVTKGS
ncbi:hypothetical protein ASPZODRAFT_1655710 [Penicilliopsis zonata CBS 506.65]|uniref:Secreted protein n=1 Tax=Penicilliopsis zonata CBS 506.65 TaxID=1073090 RepID=A0A1L9SN41_9EURO|nr:hypothetical protein ASPZODRAFT_1655710 [Penicilliopsis zonata CBS 506.65]OJJ48679.1 hypothetical protein ASPZODRAFT_1655710 [Penicilliopsis zonata CBS 506.65]